MVVPCAGPGPRFSPVFLSCQLKGRGFRNLRLGLLFCQLHISILRNWTACDNSKSRASLASHCLTIANPIYLNGTHPSITLRLSGGFRGRSARRPAPTQALLGPTPRMDDTDGSGRYMCELNFRWGSSSDSSFAQRARPRKTALGGDLGNHLLRWIAPVSLGRR